MYTRLRPVYMRPVSTVEPCMEWSTFVAQRACHAPAPTCTTREHRLRLQLHGCDTAHRHPSRPLWRCFRTLAAPRSPCAAGSRRRSLYMGCSFPQGHTRPDTTRIRCKTGDSASLRFERTRQVASAALDYVYVFTGMRRSMVMVQSTLESRLLFTTIHS